MRAIYSILSTLTLLLGIAVIQSCQNDLDVSDVQGGLRVKLANVSSSVVTRSTPAELGTPSKDRFRLMVANPDGMIKYDGPFTEETVNLAGGTYTATVEYGENPLLALNQPYYIGTQEVTVEPDLVTEANIECKVGNALISVIFGKDEEELARFSRFYSTYGLKVKIGNQSITIPDHFSDASAYFRAGSDVRLEFTGTLKDNGQQVSYELDVQSQANFPKPFQAADHAIVTLTLPDPESALVVNISKVDIETVTLDETIPLSWLPVSAVAHSHQYDTQGNLVGTNLMFTNSYPGMEWKAVVKNSAGTIVRAVQGTGVLFSEYSTAGTWPYLPSGTYTALYYLIAEDGTESFTSSREFQVGQPRISVSVSGYSSYTLYLRGEIEAANKCERLTVYEPSATISIDESLLNNSHYSYSFTYTFDGNTGNIPVGQKSYTGENIANNAVRANPYVLKANATFDGVSAEAQTSFLITGLPYTLSTTSHDEWSNDGKTEWNNDYVQLGGWSVGDQEITTNSSVYIPQGTKYLADYNVNIHHSWVGTTFSVTVGGQEILSIKEGAVFIHKDELHSGTTDVFTANGNLTSIKCRNSYGDDYNYTQIYALKFRYGQ